MEHTKRTFLDSKAATWTIALLILYSVICFSLETPPDIDTETKAFLDASEIFVVVVFTAEYLYRVYSSERKLAFIFSAYGIIDLLAILPFYLAVAVDLRTLRLFRFMRLFRNHVQNAHLWAA
ncbi:MAG: ion transporter [Pseudomonadota bacterium]